MYHVELRQFPRNLNRFNLSGPQVGAILVRWAQREQVEVNGQNWDPKQATITVLEGPEIPVHRLSLGRGWPLAERQGEDVTARVLEEARRAVADGSAYRQAQAEAPAPQGDAGEVGAGAPASDSGGVGASETASGAGADAPASDAGGGSTDALGAGVELAALLGPDAARLLAAWREVSGRTAGLSPSESLALAERDLGGAAGR